MRFYPKQPHFSCGIALHARTMSLCVLHQEGESGLHRNLPAGPAPFLKAVAPYRPALVVCVACILTWYWLADLGARAGMPCLLGHALYLTAIHGGTATNATMAAQKLAVRLRGGRLPHASVSPATMRATRALRRRRRHRMRHRADLLAHLQNTHRPDNRPAIGQQIASKANRAGGAERCPAPAVQKRIAGALARLDHDDHLRRAVELSLLRTAKHHDAHTLDLLRTVPGIGERLSLVLL